MNFVYESHDDIAPTELHFEGSLPPALAEGRFSCNGPGRMTVGSTQMHPFDAFGRVASVHMSEGGATLRARHVDTPLLAAERSADHIHKRRLFLNKPRRWSNFLDLDLGDPCMHNVYGFAGHLIAAQDRGHYRLDLNTLEVVERMTCGGLHTGGKNLTPMPRVDPSTGHLLLWLQKPGPKDVVTFIELDPALEVCATRTVKLPAGLVHDIAFTADYYVVTRFAKLNPLAVLWGASPPFRAVSFGKDAPTLHLVPRRGGDPISIALPGRAHFHYFNAFQRDGKVVVDTIGYRGAVTFSRLLPEPDRRARGLADTDTPIPEVVRYEIDPEHATVSEEVVPGIACEAPDVNPAVRGKPYRYGYASARTTGDTSPDPGAFAWFGGVGKIDFDTMEATVWAAPSGSVCSPPAFATDPARGGAEDGGFLISWVQDAERGQSEIVVLDAQRLDAGPVARAAYPGLLGFVSHTSYQPAS